MDLRVYRLSSFCAGVYPALIVLVGETRRLWLHPAGHSHWKKTIPAFFVVFSENGGSTDDPPHALEKIDGPLDICPNLARVTVAGFFSLHSLVRLRGTAVTRCCTYGGSEGRGWELFGAPVTSFGNLGYSVIQYLFLPFSTELYHDER